RPWPNGAAVDAIKGRNVTFPSVSPFTPADLYKPDDGLRRTRASAVLFLPPGRHAPGSVPAVILLHGASGVMWAREMTYARQFASMGVAALVVDAFGARSDWAQGFVDRLIKITETMLVADAYAGLTYLKSIKAIDTKRVAMIGYSYGAMASMYAMNERFANTFAKVLGVGDTRFAGHIAYYGPCIARFADSKTTGAPLLMLYGTRDELIDPKRCAEIAADLRKGGSAVRMTAYQGAAHQWDGPRPLMRIGRILAPCRFRVEEDGTVRDRRTLLPMSGELMRKIIIGLCVSSRPYLIGRDAKVRARSNAAVARFLRQVFGERGG
ncbi:MAG: dienelactone hydrolase family protein, partial [Bauldia litoralis]